MACLSHVPLNMGRTVTRDMALIQAAGAQAEHQLMLSDDRSPWGADIFIEVSKAVPGATMEPLSGRFFTRVFEGPFRDAGKWAAEMQSCVAARGQELWPVVGAPTRHLLTATIQRGPITRTRRPG